MRGADLGDRSSAAKDQACRIGAPGTGKSLLLQVLAAQFHERFDVVLLACAQMHTRRALLQAISFELGLDTTARRRRIASEPARPFALAQKCHVAPSYVLVDEAQSLSNKLIEEIRILSNLASNGIPRVRLVLAGLPSLEEQLAQPRVGVVQSASGRPLLSRAVCPRRIDPIYTVTSCHLRG